MADQKVLQRLRNEHKRHIRRTVDLGVLPESEVRALFEGSSGGKIGQGGTVPVGPSKKPPLTATSRPPPRPAQGPRQVRRLL
ncbi:MAG: hypothetical protein VCA18_11340, partial [Opitutales bacterium]